MAIGGIQPSQSIASGQDTTLIAAPPPSMTQDPQWVARVQFGQAVTQALSDSFSNKDLAVPKLKEAYSYIKDIANYDTKGHIINDLKERGFTDAQVLKIMKQ